MLKFPASALIRIALCLLLVGTTTTGVLAKDKPNKGKPKKAEKAAAEITKLFSGSEVLRLRIDIPEKEMETLKKYQWTFGPQPEREQVQATVREGNLVYTNVALHLKGAAGSFRAIDDKPALTLNFDKFADGQRFHGLQKLSLNNSVQDPTYVSEQFSREAFLKAGVPVPRATHARVELNGRDLGLYVLVEGWDKEFLKHHFKNPKGNLYDGGFLKDVSEELTTNAGENPKDQSDRKALVEAANESDLTNRLARLEKVLDVDRFLTFIALDVMLWDWDGYPQNKNNWRLYHDLDRDKMVFMPHGLDQMFWKPEGSILPPMQGLVAKAALQIPELRQRYFNRIKELRATIFNVETMTNRVREIAAKVKPVLAEAEPKELAHHEKKVTDFCDAIARRGASLDSQLAHPIEPVKFDESGAAPLADWISKVDFGKPSLSQASDAGAKGALRIGTKDGSSIGSWRTGVWLEEGRYKLEGKVKTQGIAADPGDSRGGVALRTKTSRPEKYLLGDSDWKPIDFEFTVSDSLTEVQVLCEFRGAEGEAWFDLDSLKVKRLNAKP
ncbi:MAG TPA: CotH kinase family protein [Candidatus Eisenbacteria bacterium]|nr:CotH kinase family protein [Candidatus Eisenbacteria bacterium]